MGTLQYSSSRKGAVTIITLGGNLDLATAPELSTKLGSDIEKGAQKIILDMSGVEYIASAGLGAIISVNSRLKARDGEIRISGMSEKIGKIFKILGFSNLFKSYKNDEEALRSFE